MAWTGEGNWIPDDVRWDVFEGCYVDRKTGIPREDVNKSVRKQNARKYIDGNTLDRELYGNSYSRWFK